MQIILVAAGVVSLLVKEWGTALLLFVLTVINAVIGLREEGKAESAMNALKSMMKATARVRRDGAEAAIPADSARVQRSRISPAVASTRSSGTSRPRS